jgi:hypothetical protein
VAPDYRDEVETAADCLIAQIETFQRKKFGD